MCYLSIIVFLRDLGKHEGKADFVRNKEIMLSLQTYCKEEGGMPSLPPHLEMFVRANFLHSPDLGEAEWCFSFPPLAYSHVQDKYWDVSIVSGFQKDCFIEREDETLKWKDVDV